MTIHLLRLTLFRVLFFFAVPWYKIAASVVLVPILLLYAFGLLSNNKAKEKVFTFLFGGAAEDEFNSLARKFSLERVEKIIHPEAIEKVKWHKEREHKLVIASASLKNWILPWAKNNEFDEVIATEPEVKSGALTGKFLHGNCSKKNKLSLVKEKYPDLENYYVYVYTDSIKDQPLLDVADEKFLGRFNKL